MDVNTTPSTRTAFAPMSAARGRIKVDPQRARKLAYGLALYGAVDSARPWLDDGTPLALPEPEDTDTPESVVYLAADLALDGEPGNGPWGTGSELDAYDFWRPDVELSCGGETFDPDLHDAPDGVTWRPWGNRYDGRRITIQWDGTISWITGTGRPSAFIGRALVAAAGGLSNIPHGIVRMTEIKPAPEPVRAW